jgi:hypothetical protein
MNAGLARLLMTTQENGNLFGAQDALDTKVAGDCSGDCSPFDRQLPPKHPSTQKHPNHKVNQLAVLANRPHKNRS